MMTLAPLTHAELLAQPAADYRSAAQRQFFRTLALSQRDELQAPVAEACEGLRERETGSASADIGSAKERRQGQLRLLKREQSLLPASRSTSSTHCEPVHRSPRAPGTTRKHLRHLEP